MKETVSPTLAFTEEGLNCVMPPGPPTVTWIWADFTGRVAMRPSNVETAKSLDETMV